MAGVYINRAHPLKKKASDQGYRIGWKLRYGFERGHFDEEMTYGDAQKKAADLAAKEPDKVFWAEMIMDPKFEMQFWPRIFYIKGIHVGCLYPYLAGQM